MANLERCLGAVAPYIACWVIGDTGSTDGTQEFVRSFFAVRNIPGELHSFPFVNFAQARNEALNRARASKLRFDYLLLTDADMELTVQSPAFSEELTSAAYKVLQRSGVAYWNNRLLRRNVPASYKGVTHEYLDVRAGKTRNLEGISFIDHGTGSNRVDKYERDARLLTEAIATERDPGMIARYTFYLANTLRDSGQKEAALKAYLKRSSLGHWYQEVFISLLNAAKLKEALGYSDDEVISAYTEATAACPTRGEAIHGAARFCRNKGLYERGYEFAVQGLAVAYPNDALFVEDWIYEYGLLDELAINAYWTERYTECADACERLLSLSGGKLPASHHDRVLKNKQFAGDKLREIAARSARVNIPSEQSEVGTPNRLSEVSQLWAPSAIHTRRTALPYAVRRAADHCPDISVEDITRRIGYASYVNVQRRYMYYQVSKAGCTSMKWLLHSLERLPPIEYFIGSQRESRRDMFIHERSNLRIPSLLDLDDSTQEFVLTSPQFMRFTVIRNPYTRTESAWKDKVRLCAPTYEKYYQAIRGGLPTDHNSISPISFREFVEAISKEDLVNSDAHWRLQIAQILRGALNLSHIGRLEDFSETIRAFHAHQGEVPPRLTSFNRTAGTSHYDESLATAIYELYRQDFDAFSYDQDSWVRPSKDRTTLIPEVIFVDEVLERNIVIGHLYRERDALKRRVQELERHQTRRTDNDVTVVRSGRPTGAGALMTLLEAAWQQGELAHPADAVIAAHVEAAATCAAPAEALYEAARFCRGKGLYDASTRFCEAGFALLAPPEQGTLLRKDFAAGLQEEFSIAANYSSAPAIKDRGFASCNWLALSREVTERSRGLARWNLFFYIKAASAVLPSFTARPVRFKAPNGFRAMNSSVARQGRNIFVAQRCVNYTVTDNGKYVTPDGGLPHTRNYLLRLGDELDIQSAAEILGPANMPVSSATRLQDPRLFNWRDALWCVAGVRDLIQPGWCEQMLARVDQDTSEVCRLADWRVLRPEGQRQFEKNWMPQILGDRLRFIYLCDPTRMLDDHARTAAETSSPVAADEFRGGTQAIEFDGGWLTLIHEVSLRDRRRYYWHRFVWFDLEDALRRVSRPIYFHQKGIEFAAGLAWHPDGKRLLISYGVNDCESWIATVDAGAVRDFLEDAEQLPSGIPGQGALAEERWPTQHEPVALSAGPEIRRSAGMPETLTARAE
jgi:glycosyltransferase involved in cell wall biosynthesis